jgi:glycosyltransferase involved in cell wall biosynthesis
LKFYQVIKKYDVALVHTNGVRGTFYAGLAAMARRVPTIWHVRVLGSDDHLFEDKILYALVDRIIVVSKAVRSRFYWAKDQSKVRLIYNGVDLSQFSCEADTEKIRRSLGLKDQVVVGVVAQLVPSKGLDILIKAFRSVWDSEPRARLLVIGEEPDNQENYFKKLRYLVSTLGLTQQVTFLGYREDVSKIISICDIGVLSSLSEGFGRVLIEFMAAGKPVVGSAIGGIPEIVANGTSGFLVSPGDEKALTEAILRLLKDPHLSAQFGREGKKRADLLFNIADNVAQTQRVYRELTSK